MVKQGEEHLRCYIESLVEEGEIKKCYVTNLKANNTERSVILLVNKKLMCSIMLELERMTDKKRKQQNSHCCQLPLLLPRVCKLVVLRKLKINGIDLSTLLIVPSLLQLDFTQISSAPKLFCHSSCSCKNANLSSESRIYCAKFPHSIYDQKYFI